MKKKVCLLMVILLIAGFASNASAALGIGETLSKTETFYSPTTADANGWAEIGSRSGDFNFGFADGNSAGGEPNQAGGVFPRASGKAYYADTVFIGQTFDLSYAMSFTAKINLVTGTGNTNNPESLIGFLGTSGDPYVQENFMGIIITRNDNPAEGYSIRLGWMFDDDIDDNNIGDDRQPGKYMIAWRWDPAAYRAYAAVYDVNGVELDSEDDGYDPMTQSLNAFGMSTRPRGSDVDAVTNEFYIDDVTYTATRIAPTASDPVPSSGSTPVMDVSGTIQWTLDVGTWYNKQVLYWGTDSAAVNDANETSYPNTTKIVLTSGEQLAELGLLPHLIGTTQARYYWRVDGVGAVQYKKGPTWNFRMADHYYVDSFELYADTAALTATWNDGSTDAFNGAYIDLGTETKLAGNNAAKFSWDTQAGKIKRVMTYRSIPATSADWDSQSLAAVQVWFYGDPANAYPIGYENPGDYSLLYMAIDNDTDPLNAATKVYYDGDPCDIFVAAWHEWNVALADFGVSTANVRSFGIGTDVDPVAYGPSILIDELMVWKPRCIASKSTLTADLNGDCIVNTTDLNTFKASWLFDYEPNTPDANLLLVHFNLEETTGNIASDSSSKGLNGLWFQGSNADSWDISNPVGGLDRRVAGFTGNAIRLASSLGHVAVMADANAFSVCTPSALGATLPEATVSFWIRSYNGRSTGSLSDIIRARNQGNSQDQVRLRQYSDGRWNYRSQNGDSITAPAGSYAWDEFNTWSHMALTTNANTNVKRIWVNGAIVAQGNTNQGIVIPVGNKFRFGVGAQVENFGSLTDFELQSGACGDVDDIRFYSYALPVGDIAGLESPYYSPGGKANMYSADYKIDFKDYSVLADQWMDLDYFPFNP